MVKLNYGGTKLIGLLFLVIICYSCAGYSSATQISPQPIIKSAAQIGYEKKLAYIDSIKTLNSKIPILITRLDRSEPNSAGGVDLKIELNVFSDKTIKYIRFTVDAYNRVKDKVYCEIRRESRRTGKTTGPYEKGYSSKYPLTWENLFYNNTIDCFKLVTVKIDYLDGSDETFTESDISQLMVPYKLMFYYHWKYLDYDSHYVESLTQGCCNY